MVSDLTYKFLIQFELIQFCVWCKIFFGLLLCTFPSTIYWRDYPFPIVYSWYLCCKLIDHICMGLFLGSLFCSIDLCVCFCASTILFWLLLLCSIVLNWECGPSHFVFLKNALVIWSLLWFHTNFRIVCSSSVKNAIEYW